MADKLETTMNTICKTPTKSTGSGEFGGETAGAFGKHMQTKGADVIPIKTRDSLPKNKGGSLESPFLDAFKKGKQVE